MPAVMKSIQESLDEEVDTITRDAIRQDSEIEGFGDFCDFDPHGDDHCGQQAVVSTFSTILAVDLFM